MKNLKGYKLEYLKGTKWNDNGFNWYLECKECSEMCKVGNQHVESILCSKCVSLRVNNFEDDNDKT
jgi:hypothetical protein